MAEENFFESYRFTPIGSRKPEGKTLPAWEFFYTGTLWRLIRGMGSKDVGSYPYGGFLPLGKMRIIDPKEGTTAKQK